MLKSCLLYCYGSLTEPSLNNENKIITWARKIKLWKLTFAREHNANLQKMLSYVFWESEMDQWVLWSSKSHVCTAVQLEYDLNTEGQQQFALTFGKGNEKIKPETNMVTLVKMVVQRQVKRSKKTDLSAEFTMSLKNLAPKLATHQATLQSVLKTELEFSRAFYKCIKKSTMRLKLRKIGFAYYCLL